MYYTNSSFSGNLGIDGSHGSVIDGLFSISQEMASSIGQEVMPGVQFGSESVDILEDRTLTDRVRRASASAGGPAIIHHPDDSRPSTPGFIPSLQLNLQTSAYLNSGFVVVHPPGESTPMASRLALSDIINDVTINGVRRSGTGLALENLGPGADQPVLGDLEELVAVVAEARGEYGSRDKELESRIGICLDYGHLLAYYGREGRDPVEVLERLKSDQDMVVVMHIHLNDGTSDQHILPGQGGNGGKIDEYEKILLEMVIPGFTSCRTYIIERNSPYTKEELQTAARLIAGAVPETHDE
jgi:sugar phosphate isomerase/epimerase